MTNIDFFEDETGEEIGFTFTSMGNVPEVGETVSGRDGSRYTIVCIEEVSDRGTVHIIAWCMVGT